MPSFRKAAVAAALFFSIFFLYHTFSSSSQQIRSHDTFPSAASTSSTAKQDHAASASKPSGDAGSSPTRPYPPPKSQLSHKDSTQQPLHQTFDNLRDQLAYQFDYDREAKFPAYIWQTWKYTPADGAFAENFRSAEASWSELHPGFVHEVVTDREQKQLLNYLYASTPDIIEAYDALPMPVLKADFFRYLILLARGGIYSDIDTTALKSAADWVPTDIPRSSIGLVVGVEADPDRADWKDWYSRRVQLCQWTIKAKPGHPVLREVVATITEDILRMKKLKILREGKLDKSIIEFTGPAVWTDTIFNYLNDPKYFDMKDHKNITWESFTGIKAAKKVGDVIVLPITSFSPGVQQMGAEEPDHPMAFVKHDFEGTWKPESERIHPEREAQKQQQQQQQQQEEQQQQQQEQMQENQQEQH